MCTRLKNRLVKIKKTHNCFGCTRVFSIGSEMRYLVSVADGALTYGYFCLDCYQKIEKAHDEGSISYEGVGYGEISDWNNQEE